MAVLTSLEHSLDDVFVHRAPQLPERGKRTIVEWLPWINLVLGLVTLWAAWALWHWAHVANAIINYANTISQAFGGGTVATNRMTVGIWLGVAVLVIEAVLYLAAFPATRDRRKSGWNLMFYAALVNVVYAVVLLFTDYGGFGNLLSSLIGSAIGLYFLFQIRSMYMGARTHHAAEA